MLVDSSVWIEFFRGVDTPEVTLLAAFLDAGEPVVADLVLAEVLQGFLVQRHFDTALRLFSSIETVAIGGEAIAIQAARNYRLLRGKGITIRKTIDTLLATYCIANDRRLLFVDRDFAPFVDHLGLRAVSNGSH